MFQWLKKKFQVKSYESGSIDSIMRRWFIRGNDATWYGDNYYDNAANGYCKNLVAYRCINAIAQACADVPIIITNNGRELDAANPRVSKITNLILRPNPRQNYQNFMSTMVNHRLIDGNTYIRIVKGSDSGNALWLDLLRPDRVIIETDRDNVPSNYLYEINGKQYRYPIDIEGFSDILQIKTFNPLDDLKGLSPLSAARLAIGQHNEAGERNKALLENDNTPSALLTIKDRGDNPVQLEEGEVRDLQQQLNERLEVNAGKPLVLNHDMQYTPLGFSPRDMDWLNSKNASAREICLAFGYPALLLGMPDGATFNNVSEAKLSLYEDTVIPLLSTMLDELSYWINKAQNTNINLEPDTDKVSALAPRREVARANARQDVTAGIITINEARLEIGYTEPVDGGDEPLVPAGKLPLNFDATGLDDKEFYDYLIKQGFKEEVAIKLTSQAFTKK